jgi:UDP-N-acetylmuramoyl-tripeptide--D-alanyl-D-alanine ligase
VRLPVPGLFNVSNALAAAAVGLTEGVDVEAIAAGLASFAPPAQRMQTKRGPKGSLLVIDAYNANPDSMRASLGSFVQAFSGRRLIAVLGGMRELGPAVAEEHRALGAFAAGLDLDKVFFLGEEGDWIREGWPSGAAVRLECFDDKAVLRGALAALLGSDAAVLFKASRSVRMEDVYEPLIEG